jgi:hypothetical protein
MATAAVPLLDSVVELPLLPVVLVSHMVLSADGDRLPQHDSVSHVQMHRVGDALCDVDGVGVGVVVELSDVDMVADMLVELVADSDVDVVAVVDIDDDTDRDEVGDSDVDDVCDAVTDTVGVALAVSDDVVDGMSGTNDADTVGVIDIVGVMDVDGVTDGMNDVDADRDGDSVGVIEIVGDTDAVMDVDADRDGVGDGSTR